MKRSLVALATGLALGSAALAAPASAPTTAAAPFECAARAPNVCYFRIFYTRGDRIVVLPSGTKEKVPGIVVGKDKYCMTLSKAPVFKCARKLINAANNT